MKIQQVFIFSSAALEPRSRMQNFTFQSFLKRYAIDQNYFV